MVSQPVEVVQRRAKGGERRAGKGFLRRRDTEGELVGGKDRADRQGRKWGFRWVWAGNGCSPLGTRFFGGVLGRCHGRGAAGGEPGWVSREGTETRRVIWWLLDLQGIHRFSGSGNELVVSPCPPSPHPDAPPETMHDCVRSPRGLARRERESSCRGPYTVTIQSNGNDLRVHAEPGSNFLGKLVPELTARHEVWQQLFRLPSELVKTSLQTTCWR